MSCPRRHALTLLLLGVGFQALAADAGTLSTPIPEGRLVSGCSERNMPGSLTPAERERYCRWIVRFQRDDEARAVVRPEKSGDQRAVEFLLGDLTAVQPAQIEGNRASVLAQRKTGEFVVVSFKKTSGFWRTSGMLDASRSATQSRQQRRQR